MSWWQKKLLRYGLRYGLSRTGLLEDKALDLDNLDITIGKRNVIELKDVGLNIKQISKLAQLPPCLRLETARVLSLRLIIPADFYQSSIVVEVDGLDLVVRLEEEDILQKSQAKGKRRSRSPTTTRTPQHRKTNRRIPSPPPYDPGGLSESDESVHIPTAQEVAKSFLMDEPPQERRDLEADVAANTKSMEESILSESSEGDDVGTGTGIGVPGFLAGFLQGIVDRFKLDIKNVQVRLETELPGEDMQKTPVTLRLKVGAVNLEGVEAAQVQSPSEYSKARKINFSDISVALLSDELVLAELSHLPSHYSQVGSRSGTRSWRSSQPSRVPSDMSQLDQSGRPSSSSAAEQTIPDRTREPQLSTSRISPPPVPLDMQASVSTVDADHFADVNYDQASPESKSSILDIRPGDDNMSWGSRRSQNSAQSDDLWKSMSSEGLPDSLTRDRERASTPRVLSSRTNSPSPPRQRRHVSPYDRGFQSPGSWPRADESPERHRQQQSPGSWPTLDQSHHSAMEPLDRFLSSKEPGVTDNKRHALEQTEAEEEQLETPPEPQDAVPDDMLESRLYEPDYGRSVYMSAYATSPQLHVPGDFGPDEIPSSPEVSRSAVTEDTSTADNNASSTDAQLDREVPSGNVTPRAPSPQKSFMSRSSPSKEQVARELIFIDTLSVSIPLHSETDVDDGPGQELSHRTHFGKPNRLDHGMPGAFSAYSDVSSSRSRGTASVYSQSSSVLWSPSREPSDLPATRSEIAVATGTVRAQVDVPTGRLLFSLGTKIAATLASSDGSDTAQSSRSQRPEVDKQSLSVQVGCIELVLRKSLEVNASLRDYTPSKDDTLSIHCSNAHFVDSGDIRLDLGSFGILLGGQELLAFDKDLGTSQALSLENSVVAIGVTQNRFAASKRPVTDVSIETASLHLQLDLSIIDDTFASFGGLSGILELGNSVVSDSSIGSPVMNKPAKGVRFAGDSAPMRSTPELKINGRIGGAKAILIGPACSLSLSAGTIKFVYREQGAIATVHQLSLQGPYSRVAISPSPFALNVAALRVDYLIQPDDKDLERLLSLLTPSKDKYDNDDDIMLDTLLRQRRKGSVLRASIGDIKVKFEDWDCLSTLATLSADLSKLSAVTKYLPEDERPGLLTLLRIKDAEAQIPVNERFGKLRIASSDLHLAHVGIPPLLAFSIGALSASQVRGGHQLLRSLIPLGGSESSPAVMARMLGDEEEPTIKVKLFNLCAEYSVPVILALTNMDKAADPEEVAKARSASVADSANHDTAMLERSPGSDLSKAVAKKLTLDLLIHDSAIGLAPQKLPSKALLVLSDTHLSTKLPPEDAISATLELRKASLFLTDRENAGTAVSPGFGAHGQGRVAKSLSQQNYVSIGTMMSAAVVLSANDSADQRSKTVEVNVKNELLLLETCADSTHTLTTLLGDLAPPTPPSKEPKYLVQPEPIEDVIASFSGEAVPQKVSELSTSVMFDVEEEDVDEVSEFEMPLDVSVGESMLNEEPDELLAASAMAGSLYGPVSGVLGVAPDDESTMGDDYPETAESLLEDDPFEMTTALDDRLKDDALMRDLSRQCKPARNQEPVDLELYEIEDLGFDAMGSGQQALGSRHRFAAPYIGGQREPAMSHRNPVPFRLRLRDFHVIWHLYDGYDWQHTRDGIVEAVEEVEKRSEERKAKHRRSQNDREDEESVIGDFLFNSIYIGVPTSMEAQDLRRHINRNIDEDVSETASVPVSGISRPTTASGQPSRPRPRRRLKLGRSKNHKIAFELKSVSADVLVFPPGGEALNSVDLRIKNFEIFDKVPTSTWRKFLTHMSNDPSTREMSKPMFHIQLDTVKTLMSHAASELLLHVNVLPLRLHVDQDALDFITRFFEFKDDSIVSEESSESDKPFIQRVEVETVDLCLDYKPKKIDYAGLRSGKTTEFMNIITLEGANIRLKHAIHYGVGSPDRLHSVLNDIWMADVKSTQLPTVLAGLAPVRSLVNLGSGVKDVVAIPVREYKKDGRIMRSVQKGAFQFGKTTTAELARLGAKVALGTQTFLSNAEGLLVGTEQGQAITRRTPGDTSHDVASASDDDEPERRAVSAYSNQPLGVLSGLRSARRYLEHDLLTARDALIAVQGEFLESRGPGDLAGAVARHAPTVILRPVIGASRAVGTTLLGVSNQVDKSKLREANDKYKHR